MTSTIKDFTNQNLNDLPTPNQIGINEVFELRVDQNNIKTVSFIPKGCISLSASNNKISKIGKLNGPNYELKFINLSFNRVISLAGFELLCNLRELNLSNNYLYDEQLVVLRKLSIKKIDLSHNSLKSNEIAVLIGSLKKLEVAIISSNHLEALDFSIWNSCLVRLEIDFNKLTSLTFGCSFSSLNFLSISNNQIESFQIIENLGNLEVLIANDNFISDISFLEHLPIITVINLNNNCVGKQEQSLLRNSLNFPTIKVLEVSNNSIFEFIDFDNLKGLETLRMDGNKIAEIIIKSNHMQMQKLFLQNNLIENCKCLFYFPKLLELDLSFNRIDNPKSFYRILNKLTQLRQLYLVENPFNRDLYNLEILFSESFFESLDEFLSNSKSTPKKDILLRYRSDVLNHAGWLEKLDNILVTDKERNNITRYETKTKRSINTSDGFGLSKKSETSIDTLRQRITNKSRDQTPKGLAKNKKDEKIPSKNTPNIRILKQSKSCIDNEIKESSDLTIYDNEGRKEFLRMNFDDNVIMGTKKNTIAVPTKENIDTVNFVSRTPAIPDEVSIKNSLKNYINRADSINSRDGKKLALNNNYQQGMNITPRIQTKPNQESLLNSKLYQITPNQSNSSIHKISGLPKADINRQSVVKLLIETFSKISDKNGFISYESLKQILTEIENGFGVDLSNTIKIDVKKILKKSLITSKIHLKDIKKLLIDQTESYKIIFDKISSIIESRERSDLLESICIAPNFANRKAESEKKHVLTDKEDLQANKQLGTNLKIASIKKYAEESSNNANAKNSYSPTSDLKSITKTKSADKNVSSLPSNNCKFRTQLPKTNSVKDNASTYTHRELLNNSDLGEDFKFNENLSNPLVYDRYDIKYHLTDINFDKSDKLMSQLLLEMFCRGLPDNNNLNNKFDNSLIRQLRDNTLEYQVLQSLFSKMKLTGNLKIDKIHNSGALKRHFPSQITTMFANYDIYFCPYNDNFKCYLDPEFYNSPSNPENLFDRHPHDIDKDLITSVKKLYLDKRALYLKKLDTLKNIQIFKDPSLIKVQGQSKIIMSIVAQDLK